LENKQLADTCEELDIEFRFDTDTPPGKDPDSHSPTLRRYHKRLWSKALPNGHRFELEDAHSKSYLYHNSELGEFFLSSDAITHSYRKTKRIAHVIEQVPPQVIDAVFANGSTIGAYTVFPANRIDKKATINGMRGLNSKIHDRFDISLECIRRHYKDIESPLSEVLRRYGAFFALFQDFRGYVDFFHFQDLVAADYSEVKFHLPYRCFEDSPLPRTKDEYLQYGESTIKFIRARATRMKASLCLP
jgi:hypothetical protein